MIVAEFLNSCGDVCLTEILTSSIDSAAGQRASGHPQ
jgi:hypothetical protein